MKGFYIFESETRKEAVDCLELGDIVQSHRLEFAPGAMTEEIKMQALVSKETISKCSKDDTYDFETGALIALMKMCGKEKALKAVEELYSLKEPRGADLDGDILESKVEHMAKKNAELLGENSRLNYIKSCNESTIESLENTRDLLINKNNELKKEYDELFESDKYSKSLVGRLSFEKHRLEEENEKLKLDCEKLQHGYNDMMFCGGRVCGKQYTALVALFKKLDQKKVDAAYKEAYNTTLPVWQKEALRQAYEIRKESKEKTELPRTLDINGTIYRKSIQIKDFGEQINKLTVDSLIEESRVFTRKCVDEWLYKIPTRREHMWEDILKLHKTNDVIIKVNKEDINTFWHEIEDKIPEITWCCGAKIFESKLTRDSVQNVAKKANAIYFRVRTNNWLSYASDPSTYKGYEPIAYLPPMRWDLFKKGRLAVKVNYDNYKEFYEACEKELGRRPISGMFTGDFTVSICKKDGLFEVFTVKHQKETGKKIVDWEDVRENETTTEDPYDTWKW